MAENLKTRNGEGDQREILILPTRWWVYVVFDVDNLFAYIVKFNNLKCDGACMLRYTLEVSKIDKILFACVTDWHVG